MTKKEWSKQLKRNLKELPKSERERITDYFDEMFSDKADAGMSEAEILLEFGSPYDAAQKLLAEYGNEKKDEEKPQQKRGALGTTLLIVWQIFAFFIVVPLLFSLLILCVSLVACMIATAIAGAGGCVYLLVDLIVNGYAHSFIAYIGVCAAAIGLGLMLSPLCIKLCSPAWKLISLYFKKSAALFRGEKAV